MTLRLGNGYKSDGVAPGSRFSLLTDGMGRRGLGCKPRKTLIFHCGFSHASAQHQVLLWKEAKKPSPPLLTPRIPLPTHSSVPGLAGSVTRTVPSPQRDSHCGMSISQPMAPPCLIPALTVLQGTLQVTNQACFTPEIKFLRFVIKYIFPLRKDLDCWHCARDPRAGVQRFFLAWAKSWIEEIPDLGAGRSPAGPKALTHSTFTRPGYEGSVWAIPLSLPSPWTCRPCVAEGEEALQGWAKSQG